MKTTENKAVYTFAPHSVTCNGQEFPAEYSINPTSKTVYAFLTVQEDGRPVKLRLRVEPNEPEHSAILAAAQRELDERKAAKQEQPATIDQQDAPKMPEAAPVEQDAPKMPEAAPVEQDAPKTPEAAPVEQDAPQTFDPAPAAQQERDPKQARGPIPEKPFIGLEIKGNGWKIFFDGDHERTRVIFKDDPSAKIRATVEKAGFYWSPMLQSWNKKLTFKAYRAAQALAHDLRAVCG